jgi:hypothetical protein
VNKPSTLLKGPAVEPQNEQRLGIWSMIELVFDTCYRVGLGWCIGVSYPRFSGRSWRWPVEVVASRYVSGPFDDLAHGPRRHRVQLVRVVFPGHSAGPETTVELLRLKMGCLNLLNHFKAGLRAVRLRWPSSAGWLPRPTWRPWVRDDPSIGVTRVALSVSERLPLSRFIFEPSWTPVLGTYLYPLKLLDVDELPTDPNDYLEVIRVVPVTGMDVAITRGGGLFVRDRGQYSARQAIDALVQSLNILTCEFTLAGLVSQPVTDIDVQSGKLIGKYVSITGGWGSFGERTWGPYALLCVTPRDMSAPYRATANPYWPPYFYWTAHNRKGIVAEVEKLANAPLLSAVAPGLPSLVAAAAFHATRHNMSETIINSWVVVELILYQRWMDHLTAQPDSGRRRRLKDTRTYSASVQAEVLLTAGLLPADTYDKVQSARKTRNDFTHKGDASADGAAQCMEAMRAMLSLLGVRIDRLKGYSYQAGGIGSPLTDLEPEFPFK